jgi:hypothetical protein
MSVGSGRVKEEIIILKVPTIREITLSILDFLLKLPEIDFSFSLEVYLSEDSQESNW